MRFAYTQVRHAKSTMSLPPRRLCIQTTYVVSLSVSQIPLCCFRISGFSTNSNHQRAELVNLGYALQKISQYSLTFPPRPPGVQKRSLALLSPLSHTATFFSRKNDPPPAIEANLWYDQPNFGGPHRTSARSMQPAIALPPLTVRTICAIDASSQCTSQACFPGVV